MIENTNSSIRDKKDMDSTIALQESNSTFLFQTLLRVLHITQYSGFAKKNENFRYFCKT